MVVVRKQEKDCCNLETYLIELSTAYKQPPNISLTILRPIHYCWKIDQCVEYWRKKVILKLGFLMRIVKYVDLLAYIIRLLLWIGNQKMFEKWQICVHLIIETNSLREINKTQISKKINLYKYTSHQNWIGTNNYFLYGLQKYFASSGNRTRAARVAGEHSTTEPTMLR